jgi:endonuclease/exonuclease/phosphatase family metal-dependent hydrolase
MCLYLFSIVYNIIFSFVIKIIDIFNYDKGNIIKNIYSQNKNDNVLNILSYNIDNLFVHYDFLKNKRLLNDLKNIFFRKDIDIICLQEVWNTNFKNKLIIFARQNNWNYAVPYNKKKYFIGENSGLIIFSKYTISEQKIHIYKNSKGTCSLSNKSAQYVKIQLNINREINIINTHLQSSHLSHYQDFRKTTIKQLEELINNSPYKNSLVVGDINLDYDFLKKNLNNQFNFLNNYSKIITFPLTNDHLDHFLYFGNEYNYDINCSVLNIHNSDHIPVLASIIFN